ncbi:MAG: 1-acyl-sn-glycerol-3-phosphate acyltransferase [Paracoccaceae bacterium]|nr:1-acyl-sn-glycerol-3-phosphate acyltransferase [Paracoccaceae bacterium]PDH57932.1 MAG: glycerol acyltransferase [Rhodobacteraceae bacterium MED-G07]|tara:strand:- start:8393 stop:9289 length:897 start_codon:yes stop_codon:yes gene_type:complete
MKKTIDTLLIERASWIKSSSYLVNIFSGFIKYLLRYQDTINIAQSVRNLGPDELLTFLANEFTSKIKFTGLENVPEKGPFIVVVNHPTGISDAVVLYSVLRQKRSDPFFFANRDVLRVFPQLSNVIAPIEWRKEKRNQIKSRETLEFFKSAIQSSRPCIIFPSGRIAKRTGIQLTERPWVSTAVSLAKRYSLPIVPINIKARNSLLFYILDLIHPTLRDISLFYETINKVNFSFDINIGNPISPNSLSDDNHYDTEFLRLHTLRLNSSSKRAVSWLPLKYSKFLNLKNILNGQSSTSF